MDSVDGLDTKNKYPSIYNFLSQYQDKLEKRYDKGSNWYNLRPCKYDNLFEKEKLIYPNIASGLYPVYDNKKFYTNQKCFILTSNKINIKYLNGLLASNVINFMFSLIGSNLGSKGYDLNKVLIEQLPIKIDDNYFEDIVQIISAINDIADKIYYNENVVFDYLENDLNINKLSKKLENFYNLTEKQFIKEVNKKTKINNEKLLISKFNLVNEEIKDLNKKLVDLNKELDNIVYKIYNINDIEKKIIENEIIH